MCFADYLKNLHQEGHHLCLVHVAEISPTIYESRCIFELWNRTKRIAWQRNMQTVRIAFDLNASTYESPRQRQHHQYPSKSSSISCKANLTLGSLSYTQEPFCGVSGASFIPLCCTASFSLFFIWELILVGPKFSPKQKSKRESKQVAPLQISRNPAQRHSVLTDQLISRVPGRRGGTLCGECDEALGERRGQGEPTLRPVQGPVRTARSKPRAFPLNSQASENLRKENTSSHFWLVALSKSVESALPLIILGCSFRTFRIQRGAGK